MIEQSARGKANAQTSIKHKKALPSHERLKFRSKPSAPEQQLSLPTTKLLENAPHDQSSENDSSSDDEEELRAELARIKRNKARKSSAPKPAIAKKSWRRETPFQPQSQKQLVKRTTAHINDAVRDKKHRDFLNEFIN